MHPPGGSAAPDTTAHRPSLVRRLTAPLRPPPDFLVIGAMKAGTTSLYHDLLRHPQVIGATQKELHFFDSAKYDLGERWYRAQFPSSAYRTLHRTARGPVSVTGEASPTYLLYPHVPARARALAPEAKLIALLREPGERALSNYHHQRRKGREPLETFEEAIDAEEERLAGEWEQLVADPGHQSPTYKTFSYLARGIYLPQLLRWEAAFPREQLLVLHTADYSQRPQDVLDRVADFLGLDPWRSEPRIRHVGGYEPALAPGTRARLDEYFRPHNRALFEHLGHDFGWPA